MERSRIVKWIQWGTLLMVLLLCVYPASVYIGWKREVNAIEDLASYGKIDSKWEIPEKYESLLEKFPFVENRYFERCESFFITAVNNESDAADALEVLEHLKSLHFHDVELTDAILNAVARCETLEILRISGEIAVKGEAFEFLGRLSNLKSLSIENASGIDDDALRWFVGHENLRDLYLYGSRIQGSGLRHLAESRDLINLVLDDSPFNDEGLNTLANFPKLWNLSLRNTLISGVGVTNFSGAMFLWSCDFSGTSVSNEFLDVMATWPALYTLDLSGSQVGGGGFAGFTNLTQLYCLNLNETKVTDSDLETLGKVPHLGLLYLRGTSLTGRGLREIDRSLFLDLCETAVTETELKVVVEDYLPDGGSLIVSPGVVTGDWWKTVGTDYFPREIYIGVEQ